MHVFTSITSNYIPKARVLARTLKQHAPDVVFHLLLCDTPPPGLDMAREDFDHLIPIDDLDIAQRQAWIFKHDVVELCTAVKGMGFEAIFRRHNAQKVVYLDPDIAVFSGLDAIEERLERHSILLTPHQTEPEQDPAAVLDTEVTSLKFGVFNLGFLALRNSAEGLRFLDWWSQRLRDYCYDDRGRGLFTDQKWADLAPAFFPDLGIVREPQFNVSTWNLSRRTIGGSVANGLLVDGRPLCFYHFSGLDSGALKVMMEIQGGANPALEELRQWYLAQCEAMGQAELGEWPCRFSRYSNGEPVSAGARLLYRYRDELAERFPDPYDCSQQGGYQAWYREHGPGQEGLPPQEEILGVLRSELEAIHHSISWRVFRTLSNAYRRLGMKLGLRRLLQRLSRLR